MPLKRAWFHVHEDSWLLLYRSESWGKDHRGSKVENRRKHLSHVSEPGGCWAWEIAKGRLVSKPSKELFKIHFDLGDVLSRFLPQGLCAKWLSSCKFAVLKGFWEDGWEYKTYSVLFSTLNMPLEQNSYLKWNGEIWFLYELESWAFFLLHTTHRTKTSRERQLNVSCILAFVFAAVCKRHY